MRLFFLGGGQPQTFFLFFSLRLSPFSLSSSPLLFSSKLLTFPGPDVRPVGQDRQPAVEVPGPQQQRHVVVGRDERLRVGNDARSEAAAGGPRCQAGGDGLAAAEDVDGRVDQAKLFLVFFVFLNFLQVEKKEKEGSRRKKTVPPTTLPSLSLSLFPFSLPLSSSPSPSPSPPYL